MGKYFGMLFWTAAIIRKTSELVSYRTNTSHLLLDIYVCKIQSVYCIFFNLILA